jgi:hypothetical protein
VPQAAQCLLSVVANGQVAAGNLVSADAQAWAVAVAWMLELPAFAAIEHS